MQYTGLLKRYAINRPVTCQEGDRYLKQDVRLAVEPAYELSVIRINSTYMELVDKFFSWKGFWSTTVIAAMVILGGGFGMLSIELALDAMKSPKDWQLWLHSLGIGLIAVIGSIALFILLRKEAFAYTHYPIRLNRRTRMVHVFRLNGTVLTVPWDEVFFCIAALPQGDWEIQGHVLDADGVTVKETFPLSYYTPTSGLPVLERYWEFVRRYMEEGPEDAAHRVEFFMPVADRRESIANGFHRMHAELGGNFIMTVIGAALALMLVPGRWIAMQTSKVPRWPQEIEEACRIEPGDPWVRDATTVTPSAN
ncbi:MAG: hypothetical protein H6947_07395 [Zoogloeaceae bacterium]|nr:hypothetical protein [Zoogloeaceae bacterium]